MAVIQTLSDKDFRRVGAALKKSEQRLVNAGKGTAAIPYILARVDRRNVDGTYDITQVARNSVSGEWEDAPGGFIGTAEELNGEVASLGKVVECKPMVYTNGGTPPVYSYGWGFSIKQNLVGLVKITGYLCLSRGLGSLYARPIGSGMGSVVLPSEHQRDGSGSAEDEG